MNILIINPPIRLTDKPKHIPHGLAILANLIRMKLGVTPQFLDLNANRISDALLSETLRKYSFDIVLIGGLIPVYKRIIVISNVIKSINPDSVIIAGGSAAMSVPELLLANSPVDIVCTGEGEIAVVELLTRLLKGESVKNLTEIKGFFFKINGEIIDSGKRDLLSDLDSESALPSYDLLPMDVYLSNPILGFGKDIDFISSRGCPFQCTFCYQAWGRKFRAHSVEFVVDAIKHLKVNYGIDFVSFQDDEFMAKPKRVYAFCEQIKKRVPGILWSCTGRVNLVDDDIVATMKDAGCVSISYGFESGSPRMLRSMNKMASIELMERAIKINRRHGMMLPVSFIIGMPGEDDESCRETVDFCVRNNLPLKAMMFATPYPGTKLFDYAIKSGRLALSNLHEFVVSLEDARDFTINLTDFFSNQELINKRDEMIDEVTAKVTTLSEKDYKNKVKSLFGKLADDFFNDKELWEHRAKHGWIDIF